jgi:translation elongation factor EF-Tu-like GTPase
MTSSEPFELIVEETWNVTGRPPIVTGTMVSGVVQVGDRFEIVGDEQGQVGTVRGIEFHVDRSSDPRHHGLQIDDVTLAALSPGTVLRGLE